MLIEFISTCAWCWRGGDARNVTPLGMLPRWARFPGCGIADWRLATLCWEVGIMSDISR